MICAESAKCRMCVYRARSSIQALGPHCDYLLFTGHSRGCPVAGCNRFRKEVRRRSLREIEGKVRALYNEGLNDREIAEKINFSLSAVSTWRKKRGLECQQVRRRREGQK